jgi:hypothetical protein
MIHRVIFVALPIVLLTGCSKETTEAQKSSSSAGSNVQSTSDAKRDSSIVSHSTSSKLDDLRSDNTGSTTNQKPSTRVFDAEDKPLEEFAMTTCTGTFTDENLSGMHKVEVMYEMTDDEKARKYRLEMGCMYSTIYVDFSIPVSIKPSAVSCLDVQKALSKVAVCNKATSIGDLKAFETDTSSWFLFDAKNQVTQTKDQTECALAQLQLGGNPWTANIGIAEYRNIVDLHKIQFEFDGVVSFTKFYSIGKNGITCPTGFNTKNVDALSADLHRLRISIQDQIEGKPVVNV